MPNYLNTFSGGVYGVNQPQQGIGQLMPQQPGQANQPVMGQAASQLSTAVGLQPPTQNPAALSSAVGLNQNPGNPGINSLDAPQPTNMWMSPMAPRKTAVLGLPSMASGGVVPSNNKDQMVREAAMAVGGKHPNPRAAIRNFESVMGPDATNDLIRAYGTGGQIRGAGGGVDDLVPGSIDGREDVRLASGEYVIPARVVSALGDGDTERGSQILDEFVARVRAAASEAMMGSEPIDAQSLLPEV